MIYLVTGNKEMFPTENYKIITVEESLNMMYKWNRIQYDSETTGIDAHLDRLLSMQFGNDKYDTRIVVDCITISPKVYKDILENNIIIGQNLKFDLQFLYNYGIIPLRIYDTMIVEQLLHLGYPSGSISYSLKAIAERRLGVNIDKTVRGQIIWRGLDTQVILYAAGDVMYLEKIANSQYKDLIKENLVKGAKVECYFTPAIAYLEWSGIHLDENKWKDKMDSDKKKLDEATSALNKWFIDYCMKDETLKSEFIYINTQGDLFNGFDLSPKCNINWSSSRQVVGVCKALGFNTNVSDKKTGEDKDSVLEKVLKPQKGINDDFLKLYFNYQEKTKVCSTYGQNYLDAVNPKDNRIHSVFRALGASSGRMACGSNQTNLALSKAKSIPLKRAINGVQLQNLPADDVTRAAFIPQKGNLLADCDYSALESRLGADIYNEKSMIDEFIHGSGDLHSLCAFMVYHNEIPRNTPIKDIKKLYPQLRKAVKPIEFNC